MRTFTGITDAQSRADYQAFLDAVELPAGDKHAAKSGIHRQAREFLSQSGYSLSVIKGIEFL